MVTTKKSITFYAVPEIVDWYDLLPPGEGSRRINEILCESLRSKTAKKMHRDAKQPFQLVLSFKEMQTLDETFEDAEQIDNRMEDEVADFDDPEIAKVIAKRNRRHELRKSINQQL